MKRTRHTAEQIIRKLKTAEQLIAQGKTVADVCRVIEVTQPTYHHWRQQYGGMQAEEARRLTQLEKENARLKKLLAEAELEKAMLCRRLLRSSGNSLRREAHLPVRWETSEPGHRNASSAGWWGSPRFCGKASASPARGGAASPEALVAG